MYFSVDPVKGEGLMKNSIVYLLPPEIFEIKLFIQIETRAGKRFVLVVSNIKPLQTIHSFEMKIAMFHEINKFQEHKISSTMIQTCTGK